MSTIESALLSAAEEAALGELMSGPLVGVHIRIAVKFRAMHLDLGTVTVIDHSFQWPIPAIFASANPHPVALNTHGIQLDVTLSIPPPPAPVSTAALPAPAAPDPPAVEAPASQTTAEPIPLSPAAPGETATAAATSPTGPATIEDPTPTASADSTDPAPADQAQPAGGDVLGDGI